MSTSDLLRRLRLADDALASIAPSADLEARIRARVRGRGAPRLAFSLAGLLRLRRPLVLAFATATAVFAVAGLREAGIGAPPRLADGTEDPAEHIVNDRSRSDSGPSEPPVGERMAPPPNVHAPSLDRHPDRLDPAVIPAAPPPLSVPPAIRPSEHNPAVPTPLKANDDDADRRQRPSRLSPSHPAVASMPRAAAVATSGAAPSFRLPLPTRSGGNGGSREGSPSGSPGAGASGAESDCKTPNALRESAAAGCEATGLVLGAIMFLDSCGDGRFGSAYSECADPDVDAKPTPTPAPSQCVQGTLSGYSCVDLGNDEKYPVAGGITAVTAACDKLGLLVSSMSTSAADCGPHSGKVAYVCCPAAPAGPSDQGCHEEKVWSDACEDLASLEAKATALCAEGGDALSAMTPFDGCSDGKAMLAEITCCPP